MEVGVRELRAHLSRYLKRVEEGEEILVTDRGKPVARITPANGRSRLEQLIEAGIVHRAPKPWKGPLPKPIQGAGPLSDIVLGDRR
jgi:prevent-host-death family protein